MILCCGEALIDMIAAPVPGGTSGFLPQTGGAAFNTTVALGRLGARAGLVAGLSTDAFGRQLCAALAEAGADSSLSVFSARPTTLAFVDTAGEQASYRFYDENSASAMLEPSSMPQIPPQAEVMLFGGISLCKAPAAEAFLALAKREAGRRAVMLDPNVRPGFARDEAAYRDRLEQMMALSAIVKVSGEDLDWLRPGPASLETRARGLLQDGPAMVLLTRGSEGADAFVRGGLHLHVPAVPAKLADAVGAGDTFNAGFLAQAVARGLLPAAADGSIGAADLQDCLEFAARVAAVSVSRPGADPPWRHELP